MDQWRIAVLGDGGVGKTALAVQVSPPTSAEAAHARLAFRSQPRASPHSSIVHNELLRWCVYNIAHLTHMLTPSAEVRIPLCAVHSRRNCSFADRRTTPQSRTPIGNSCSWTTKCASSKSSTLPDKVCVLCGTVPSNGMTWLTLSLRGILDASRSMDPVRHMFKSLRRLLVSNVSLRLLLLCVLYCPGRARVSSSSTPLPRDPRSIASRPSARTWSASSVASPSSCSSVTRQTRVTSVRCPRRMAWR